jgi:hypothetical protein
MKLSDRLLAALIVASVLGACSGQGSSSTPPPLQYTTRSSDAASSPKWRGNHGHNQYHYGGCGIFPPGDVFNHDAHGYVRDQDTYEMFAKAPQGNFAYWDDQSNEQVNVTTSSSVSYYPVASVTPQPFTGHNPALENSPTMPWKNGFFIEQGDSHAIVLLSDLCQDYEAYYTEWTAPNGPIAAFSGRENVLANTWASQLVNGQDAVTQAGVPLLPTTYWGEDASATVINHIGSILLVAGSCLSQYGYAFPATAPSYVADTQNCTHPIHMGDLFKLRGDFNCTAYVTSVANLCRSMKHYPLVVDDALSSDSNEPWALRFGMSASGQKMWPYSGEGGLQQFLTALTPSATVWVHVEPPGYQIQCISGHTYGVDCW